MDIHADEREADKRIDQLEKENQELKASIPEIQAKAIEDAVEATCNSWDAGLLNGTYIEDAFFQYAQKIREGK